MIPITPLQFADALRKEGKYAEAIQAYAKSWTVASLSAKEWDIWSYAYCMVKCKQYNEALDFCRKAYPTYPAFAPLNNVYAWAVYYTAIAPAKPLADVEFWKAAKGIVRLCPNRDVYSPFVITVFKVLECLAAKNTFPHVEILEWTALLDPAQLEDTPFAFVDAKGKKVELASKREQYFALRAKALLAAKQQESCIALVAEAFAQVTKFHYGNEFWLRRMEALALADLGRFAEAVALLETVFQQRKEWFLAMDLAKIKQLQGNANTAWAWCVKAVALPGDVQMRLGLYKLMGSILLQRKEVNLAMQHYELVDLIRGEQGWAADMEVRHVLSENTYVAGARGSSLVVLAALNLAWAEFAKANEVRLKGTISKLLPHGKAGFIQTGKGVSYYFQVRDVKGKNVKIEDGTKVTFVLEAGFDKVKNKATKNAVEVLLSC